MNPPGPSARDLLAACGRGDARAQEAFYRRWFPVLMPICLRYLRDRQEAGVVLNRAMLAIMQAGDGYREQGKLEGWLVTVTRNTVLNHIRDERRAQRRVLDRDFSWPASVPNRALSELAVEDIIKLLQRLPDHLRVVFNLVVFDGYSHAEVARELDIATTASRYRLKKARELLRGHYRHTHGEKGFGS